MTTYKLGNKVKAILRAYSPGKIGSVDITYNMQPYTILDTTDAQVIFRDNNVSAKSTQSTQSFINYNVDFIDSVQLNNVKLTDKILNLIFTEDSEPLHPMIHNLTSNEDRYIYLPISEEVYQVFVYNVDGELEAAYDTLTQNYIIVDNPNTNYLIIYLRSAKKGYFLNRLRNITLALDLEITGNENDSTETFWMHFDKCSLSVNKNLYFNNGINTVDLQLKVLKSDNDYITLQ